MRILLCSLAVAAAIATPAAASRDCGGIVDTNCFDRIGHCSVWIDTTRVVAAAAEPALVCVQARLP